MPKHCTSFKKVLLIIPTTGAFPFILTSELTSSLSKFSTVNDYHIPEEQKPN